MREITFLNVRMNPISMEETIGFISRRIQSRVFTQHSVVNVAKIVNMQSDSLLKNSVEACNVVNIDGMGVVWGAKLLGHNVSERVSGIDLFIHLLEKAEIEGWPVFFLGATEEVIDRTVLWANKKYPELKIAGSHNGYFGDDEEAVVDKVSSSGAYLLFVAMSSPLKENFIDRWKNHLDVLFVMGVGGSFDVVSGKTKRAPLWMQKSGLEWLYRVIQEPQRMWKRYLKTNTKFLWLVLKSIVKK